MKLLKEIEKIVLDAGNILKTYFSSTYYLNIKSDYSPVTQADIHCSEFLVEELKKYGLPVVSEENIHEFDGSDFGGSYWLLDPLDGTKQFIKHLPEFCISLALIENGVPTLGVIYAPILNELYSAKLEKEFHSNMKIEAPKEDYHILISNESSIRKFKDLFELLDAKSVTMIKSAIKYGRMALNRHNFYFRNYGSHKWDIAAGDVILKTQNFSMLDLDLNPIDYTNPFIENDSITVIHNDHLKDIKNIMEFINIYSQK